MKKAKIIKNGNVNFENLNSEGNIKDSFNIVEDASIILSLTKTEEYDENWALNEAVKFANQSSCRSKRGVIIWHRYRGLLGWGFNNIPQPFKCDGSDECKKQCAKTAIHAEQQALLNFSGYALVNECEMLHVKSVDGKAVFSEKPSCWQCSKLILASGIKFMWLYTKDGLVKWSAEEFHRETLKNNNLL